MHLVKLTISSTFFMFIIWMIYLANTGQDSIFFEFVRQIPFGDKIAHLCLFGLLTLLANLTFKFKVFKFGGFNVYLGTGAVYIFVTIEELSQYFIPARTLDLFDFSANMLGILLFTWLSSLLAKRHESPIRELNKP